MPDPYTVQRMRALGLLATEARQATAKIRAEVKSLPTNEGLALVADLLRIQPPGVRKMAVGDLLCLVLRWGSSNVGKILLRTERGDLPTVGFFKPVGMLSERQAELLASLLEAEVARREKELATPLAVR